MISFNGRFSDADLIATLRALGREVFFVQVGAMDGVTHDPIHPLVKELGWQGLLVEPIPYLNQKLRDNYRDCAGLSFAELAITDFEGGIEMAYIDPASAEPGVFQPGAFGTSTVLQDRGPLGGKGIEPDLAQLLHRNTRKIAVVCCRLPVLLARHGVTRIDLMVVDTEGADWLVLRQLSFGAYQPRVIYFEFNHLSDYEKIAAVTHFRNHGYALHIDEAAENVLAVKA